MPFDKCLIEHCSPTLASLKTANLFLYRYEDESDLQLTVERWKELLVQKGVELIILKKGNGLALIYVYRRKMLEQDLKKNGVGEFLNDFGYQSTDTDYAIKKLKDRLETYTVFPHEIGIFLNYPLGDVKGFIEQGGKNSICNGCWKVYCNECETIKLFEKFKKCREVYSRLYSSGTRNITQLTVNA